MPKLLIIKLAGEVLRVVLAYAMQKLARKSKQ